MELLRTLAFVGRHRPASQKLVRGAIVIGYMQIPICVDYGFRFQPVGRHGRVHLPVRGDGDHCRYTGHANAYEKDSLHDQFFTRVTLLWAFLESALLDQCPTGDRTGSKPHLSWRWRYGKRRIPSPASIWQLELLAHDD